MSKLSLASATPLFDRLLGVGDGSQVDQKLDSAGLRDSLARDMSQLFSTKSRLTMAEFMQRDITVLDYGLPDFCAMSPSSQSDMDLMTEVIAKALQSFEPRLSQVGVTLSSGKNSTGAAHAAIIAAVTLSGQALRVNFDLAFSASGALTLQPG